MSEAGIETTLNTCHLGIILPREVDLPGAAALTLAPAKVSHIWHVERDLELFVTAEYVSLCRNYWHLPP